MSLKKRFPVFYTRCEIYGILVELKHSLYGWEKAGKKTLEYRRRLRDLLKQKRRKLRMLMQEKRSRKSGDSDD